MKYEKEIYAILYNLGIIKPYIGCRYIACAMQVIDGYEKQTASLTKSLYIDVASLSNTSVYCVERDIRAIAEMIWALDDNKTIINDIFGCKYVYKRPTNKEFLWMLYEYVKYESEYKKIHNKHCRCPSCGKYLEWDDVIDKQI